MEETHEINTSPPQPTSNREYEFNAFYSAPYTDLFGYSVLTQDYDAEQLRSLVRDPMANNSELRRLSRMLYSSNGILSNTIDYMVSLLTLDRVVVPMGKANDNKKKQCAMLMEDTLHKINDKAFIRDALFRDLLDGISYYYFEKVSAKPDAQKYLSDNDIQNITEINELGINIALTSLDPEYTRIVGIKNSRYTIAFDLNFFSNGEGEPTDKKLRRYPKEIRDGYQNWVANKKSANQWLVLDNTKTLVHKIRATKTEPYGRPLALAALQNILYNDFFIDTKRNVLATINNRVIYQCFPESAQKGMSALTDKQQEAQHNAVKSAIHTKTNQGGTSFFSLAAGTKLDTIKVDTSILDEKMEGNLSDNIAMDLGFASSLLNGASSGNYSSQTNNLNLVISQIHSWVEEIASELVIVLNTNIINDKKCFVDIKYLPCSIVTRKDFVNEMKELYTLGHGSLQAWIAATGINPTAYISLLEQEKGWDTLYPPHATSFTTSGNDDGDSGRPTNDNPTNPNTIDSKSKNSNNQPKPSTK